MSFYHLPHPWAAWDNIPKYVLAEPPGRGTFTTAWLPRRTISQLQPDFLARPVVKKGSALDQKKESLGSLSDTSLGPRVYELESLGTATPLSKDDPIRQYGTQGAQILMQSMRKIPAGERAVALHAALDAIDKTLWANVNEKSQKFRAQGFTAAAALQKAIAASLSNYLGNTLVKLGQRGPQAMSGYQATGGIFGSVSSAVKGITGAAGSATKSAVDKIEKLTCKIVSNPATPAIAGGIAATQGVPPQAGAAGAQMAQSLCSTPTPTTAAVTSTTPAWVLPAAIGGGALLLILALK